MRDPSLYKHGERGPQRAWPLTSLVKTSSTSVALSWPQPCRGRGAQRWWVLRCGTRPGGCCRWKDLAGLPQQRLRGRCLQQRADAVLSPCAPAEPLIFSSGWGQEAASHLMPCIECECCFASFWCHLGLLEVRKHFFDLYPEQRAGTGTSDLQTCSSLLCHFSEWLTHQILMYLFFLGLKLSGLGDLPVGLLDNIVSESCSSLKSLMCDHSSVGGGESITWSELFHISS